jgi:hypothetical protein
VLSKTGTHHAAIQGETLSERGQAEAGTASDLHQHDYSTIPQIFVLCIPKGYIYDGLRRKDQLSLLVLK